MLVLSFILSCNGCHEGRKLLHTKIFQRGYSFIIIFLRFRNRRNITGTFLFSFPANLMVIISRPYKQKKVTLYFEKKAPSVVTRLNNTFKRAFVKLNIVILTLRPLIV